MIHPPWLSPDVSVDDVVAGIVVAATWWNSDRLIPARIVEVKAGGIAKNSAGPGPRWRIVSTEEGNGSRRAFFIDHDAAPDGWPMSGAFALFVGAALDVDGPNELAQATWEHWRGAARTQWKRWGRGGLAAHMPRC